MSEPSAITGGIRFTITGDLEQMATWSPERIKAVFDGLAVLLVGESARTTIARMERTMAEAKAEIDHLNDIVMRAEAASTRDEPTPEKGGAG